MLGRYHAAMQADLRNLQSFQEIYYATHERYASDACADGGVCAVLGAPSSPQVSLSTTGTARGWSAVATHAELSAERCDIYVGDAAAPGVSTEPGFVTCTPFWP